MVVLPVALCCLLPARQLFKKEESAGKIIELIENKRRIVERELLNG